MRARARVMDYQSSLLWPPLRLSTSPPNASVVRFGNQQFRLPQAPTSASRFFFSPPPLSLSSVSLALPPDADSSHRARRVRGTTAALALLPPSLACLSLRFSLPFLSLLFPPDAAAGGLPTLLLTHSVPNPPTDTSATALGQAAPRRGCHRRMPRPPLRPWIGTLAWAASHRRDGDTNLGFRL